MLRRGTFWLLFRVAFSALVMFFLFVRWFLPSFPVDLPAIGLIALLVTIWVMPYLKRFTLPGGAGGEFGETLPVPRVVIPAATQPPKLPQELVDAEEVRRVIRARMLAQSSPQVRSMYSTLIETAFFVLLETRMTEPGDQVERYPRIIVDGKPSWCSFHALVRPKNWRGRRFYYVSDAVGGIGRDSIETILRDIRTRADFANEVLATAPNEFVLVVVSDFGDREAEDRQTLENLIRDIQLAAKVPSFSWLVVDLRDLPF